MGKRPLDADTSLQEQPFLMCSRSTMACGNLRKSPLSLGNGSLRPRACSHGISEYFHLRGPWWLLPGGGTVVGMAAGTSLSGLPQGLPPSAFLPCWTATQRVTYPTELLSTTPLPDRLSDYCGGSNRATQLTPTCTSVGLSASRAGLPTYPDSPAPQLPLYSVVSPHTPLPLKQLPPPVFAGTFCAGV